MSLFKVLSRQVFSQALIKAQKKSFKKAMVKKMLSDSKSIGLDIFFVNILSVGIIVLILSLLYFVIFNLPIAEEYKYVSFFMIALLSMIGGVIYFIKSIEKKVEVYQNMASLKKQSRPHNFFEPVLEQLRHEQWKMKHRN